MNTVMLGGTSILDSSEMPGLHRPLGQVMPILTLSRFSSGVAIYRAASLISERLPAAVVNLERCESGMRTFGSRSSPNMQPQVPVKTLLKPLCSS